MLAEFTVLRLSSGKESTIGALYLGGEFLCFTLEDEYRTRKVWGETRIPAGEYKLGLRQFGGFHRRYSRRFGSKHFGMIEVQEVPGFSAILWHIGNTDDDTAGCLLLGDTATQNVTREGFVGKSAAAYQRVYPIVRDCILSGGASVTYTDVLGCRL